jgi:hypothetical protein
VSKPNGHATGYSLEELVEHDVIDVRGPGAVKLHDRLGVRVVAVEGAELAACVSEQHQEVLGFAASDLLQHLLLGVAVHHAREDAVLDGVEEDAAVGLGGRLLVEPGTCGGVS